MSCYMCGCDINDDNKSAEHVIANALGGHVVSYDLLCKDCNNRVSGIDEKLAELVDVFASGFMINRSRGYIPDIKGVGEQGQKITLSEGLKRKQHCTRTIENGQIHISAPNIDAAREILKALKARKYPDLDVDAAIKTAKVVEEYDNEKITFHKEVTEDCLRAATKNIVNYALHKGVEVKDIAIISEYIKGTLVYDKVWQYTRNGPLCNDNFPLSYVAIIGEHDKHLLIGYLELYSLFKFVIALDEEFIGDDIQYVYAFFGTDEQLTLNNTEYFLANYTSRANSVEFDIDSQKVLFYLENCMVKRCHNEIIQSGIQETLDRYGDIDEEAIGYLDRLVAENFIKFHCSRGDLDNIIRNMYENTNR